MPNQEKYSSSVPVVLWNLQESSECLPWNWTYLSLSAAIISCIARIHSFAEVFELQFHFDFLQDSRHNSETLQTHQNRWGKISKVGRLLTVASLLQVYSKRWSVSSILSHVKMIRRITLKSLDQVFSESLPSIISNVCQPPKTKLRAKWPKAERLSKTYASFHFMRTGSKIHFIQ